MRRRRLIKAAGVTAFAGLIAGCSEGPGAEESPTETELATEAPTETPTEQEASQETPAETGTETETETGTGDVKLEQRQGQLPQGLELTSIQFQSTGENSGQVTGTIENTGDQTYEELEVQVTLLDDTDDVLGQFFDNTEESEVETPFESGDTWDFTVDFSNADLGNAAAYRVDVDGDIDQNVDIGFGTETPTSG